MIENSVFIPLEGDAQLKINDMAELRDGQHIHQAGGHLHLDRDHGAILRVDGEGRHLVVVVVVEDDELAVVLVRLVSAVGDLVTPLLHTAHAAVENTPNLGANRRK